MLTQFGKEWWTRVLDAWNASEYRESLGNLGTVCFEVINGACVFVSWDQSGNGTIVDAAVESAPKFRASEQSWRDFVDRKFSAVAGVMLGHIEYHGAVGRILPYVSAFNELADIAKQSIERADLA